MPESLWNLDWLNHNSQRNFPLVDDASGRDTTDSIELPDDFLVDMTLAVPVLDGVDPAGFHLMGLVVLPQGALITIGHQGQEVAIASVNKLTHTMYAPYRLLGQGDFYDAYGTVVIGSFDNLDRLPAGMYTFSESGGRLVPTIVKPDIRGISSLRFQQGRDLSDPLTGDIYIIAGRNARFQVTGNQVTVDALPLSKDLATACGCEDQGEVSPCIKTLNGVLPDASGNITILGNECLVPEGGSGLIRLLDQCSEPCCGCDELKVVLDTAAMLQNEAITVHNRVIQLEGIVAQLGITISMTKLARVQNSCPTTLPYRL